ncbi:MAG: hypothetical protein EBE86_018715 [Hormoscilla sp. GUM202]|nr:hypothetical protein [Hormoscilla sp. GUM202]
MHHSLHILSSDNSLGEKSGKFKSWGRYVLIAVVVAAAIIDIGMGTPNELLSDITIAILAGMLLFNIFTEELQSPENTSFRWFVAGVIVYMLLLAGSWVVESKL